MRSILYYLSINIQDGEWLRNAILYLDEIINMNENELSLMKSEGSR